MSSHGRCAVLLLFFSLHFAPAARGLTSTTATEPSAQQADAPEGFVAVRGQVVDPTSLPVSGARVVAWLPVGWVTEAATDANGHFVLFAPAAETIEVRADHEGFQADPVRVAVGSLSGPIALRLGVRALSESLTVTAAQVDLPRTRSATQVTIIGGDELRQHRTESLGEALRLVPGLTVSATGGRGALTTMFARGGESDFALVLIDGVRVNNFGGLFDVAQLPVDAVDRIEVARGPQSALFGSDAIGGVVHVVSRRDAVSRADALLEGGSFGTWRTSSAATLARGPWRLGAAAERQSSDGFTGASLAGARVSNDDYERTTARFSTRYESARTSVFGHVRLAHNDRGVPGPFGSDPGGTYGGPDTISRTINRPRETAAGVTHALNPRARIRAQVSHARSRSTFDSPFGSSEGVFARTAIRATGDVTFSERVSASAGVEHTRERAESTFIVGTGAGVMPVERGLTGLFGEVRTTALDRMTLTLGWRAEHLVRESLDADPLAFPPRPELPADRRWSMNPKLSASYRFGASGSAAASWRASVNAGTGIRPPDAFELAFTDNPELKPERTRSIDVGLEHTAARGRVVTEAVGFVNRFDDLIVAVGRSYADASQFRTDNISNARTRGLELSSTMAIGNARVRASYTFLDSAILAVDGASRLASSPFTVGSQLIRRPRHQATLQASWTMAGITTFSRLQQRGSTLDIDPSYGAFGGTYRNDGFTVMDLGWSAKLGRALEASARVLNLFDRRYEEVLGYPALGRQFFVGVRVARDR